MHLSVPLGCCIGPVLFTCYSSTLADAKQRRQNILGYSDDHSTPYDTLNYIHDSTEEGLCVHNMQLDTMKSVKE